MTRSRDEEMKMMKMKATQRGQEAHRGPERPKGHSEAQRWPQRSIVWRHSSNTTQAGGYECHHPLLLTSNEKTGDLSLDKKQGHLFAEWPLTGREPRLTLSPSYSKALIG